MQQHEVCWSNRNKTGSMWTSLKWTSFSVKEKKKKKPPYFFHLFPISSVLRTWETQESVPFWFQINSFNSYIRLISLDKFMLMQQLKTILKDELQLLMPKIPAPLLGNSQQMADALIWASYTVACKKCMHVSIGIKYKKSKIHTLTQRFPLIFLSSLPGVTTSPTENLRTHAFIHFSAFLIF